MAFRLNIPLAQVADLGVIRDLGDAKLTQIGEAIRKAPVNSLTAKDITSALTGIVDDATSVIIVRQLLSLYAAARRQSITAEKMVEGLANGLKILHSSYRWTPEQLASWDEMRPVLLGLFGIEQLNLVAKALDLAYEYTNLYQSARILTEVRPVFSDDTQIRGAVITYLLRLSYDSDGEDRGLSIVLNGSDVKAIKESCERALAKAQATRNFLGSTGIAAVIAGEDENDDAE
jgi:hypothetical protein